MPLTKEEIEKIANELASDAFFLRLVLKFLIEGK